MIATPGFLEVCLGTSNRLRAIAGARCVLSDPATVEPPSKDHYWYSPVLRSRLKPYRAAAVVRVADPHTCHLGSGAAHEAFSPIHALKSAADPSGLLNPGKLLSCARDPFSGMGARPKLLFQ